ncbi:hypothetical protein GN157_16800 [Flavobacterium rakeshii]|uniref:Phage abortive infection protein n=1 Tax=Flavobacterium rakeshii TaxID=1038845 RepID=A0A6N8HI96_9FLAO|nr:hypothetical protein [Flavobacterium rakeshii]MUV05376.1 hypothetical protein [Flavobacterium rakeshii]
MSKNYKIVKRAVLFISIIFSLLLIVFTVDVINEVPDWIWFDIDFNDSKVANYATLISGLLSFLAILFVIFGIAEQREQVEKEREEKNQQTIDDYKDRLQLLKSLLVNITDIIVEQGKSMKVYYELELEHPTQPNVTHFSANKSFNRILEMDYLMNYQSIQYFFKSDDNWEKMFLNLNSNVDFYSESLLEHRAKYQNHIEDKVRRHREIGELCLSFFNNSSKIIERYRVKFGVSDYLKQSWVIIFNDFIPAYYDYMEECKSKGEPTDFRVLSDDFFLVFLKGAMELRNEIGFDDYGSEEQVGLASMIRKKIYEVEMYSVQYADNIKYYYEEYFDENCDNLKNFKGITEKIQSKLNEI